MRPAYWFFGGGIALLVVALQTERYFFMWLGLAALVVGSFLPGGREDEGGGWFGDGGGDGGD